MLLAEGPHRSVVAHSLYQSLSFLGVPDHKVCILLPVVHAAPAVALALYWLANLHNCSDAVHVLYIHACSLLTVIELFMDAYSGDPVAVPS